MDDRSLIESRSLPRDAVVLGTFCAVHLGDTLCTTTLPRLIRQKTGRLVYLVDNPMLRIVFEHNPHVSGYVAGPATNLKERLRGEGHMLQRLEQAFGLPVQPLPKPEIYLSDSERAWADSERRRLPVDRPVCILSTSAVTDWSNAGSVNWPEVARLLSFRYSVVQPVLFEAPVPGAHVYRGLGVRQYFALIAIADAFVGATSGGTHVAAAFSVPSPVVGWRSMLDVVRFPICGFALQHAFLYPQQWHMPAEELTPDSFRAAKLEGMLDEIRQRGRAGRATPIGNHPNSPCGFRPAIAYRVIKCGNRFARVPVVSRRDQC